VEIAIRIRKERVEASAGRAGEIVKAHPERGGGAVAGSRASALLLQQTDDLAPRRVTAGLRFLENRVPVAHHLEPSATRRHELDLRLREPLTNLGRQTGGPRFVVSHRAVFDRDSHGGNR
jgi:hypothetical protein